VVVIAGAIVFALGSFMKLLVVGGAPLTVMAAQVLAAAEGYVFCGRR